MRKLVFPILLGVSGIAVLLHLGIWQVQRLSWKEDILAEIEARISAAAVDLPASAIESEDEYLSVRFSAISVGDELHVLASGTAAGTGYRVITAYETDTGRRVLVDAGLLGLDQKTIVGTPVRQDIIGNLIWPDDVNDSTPEPDLGRNIWFGRDVVAMAQALNTEPLMVVARDMTPPDPRLALIPVDTSTIKNDHREYAITWFLMAVVWAAMTLYWIFRTTREKDA